MPEKRKVKVKGKKIQFELLRAIRLFGWQAVAIGQA